MAVTLAEITDTNRAAVLALRAAPGQQRFVGSVRDSLADAADHPHANPWYRALLADGEPVGFVMLSRNVTPRPPEIIGPWFLWRLLVDERHQGRGYGRRAVGLVVDLVRAAGATELLTSYVPEPDGPAASTAGWASYRPATSTTAARSSCACRCGGTRRDRCPDGGPPASRSRRSDPGAACRGASWGGGSPGTRGPRGDSGVARGSGPTMDEQRTPHSDRPPGGVDLPLPGIKTARDIQDAREQLEDADADMEAHELHAAGRTCARCGRTIGPDDDVRRIATGAYQHDFCPAPSH